MDEAKQLRNLAVRYAWMVHRGLATLGDERVAARYFAHAAVLQVYVLRLCTVHGEPRPCAECQGLARLREKGAIS